MTEQEVVERVARRFHAKCWWSDLADLQQEAWVAVIEARRTFDQTRGLPFHAYAWMAAVYAVRRYLWRQSAPVSGPNRRIEVLKDMQRAPAFMVEGLEATVEPEAAEQWWDDLTALLRVTVRDGDDGNLAEQVLVDGRKSAAVAAAANVPVGRVYQATAKARQRLKASYDVSFKVKEDGYE